jgi:pimeloyl-ACP methyl ester carboxylesterase
MNEIKSQTGYLNVNGMPMYYEIHGEGKPLVLIHGGGSTIQTSFGNLIPYLEKHYQIIAMELQAHGRTGDRNTDLSFKQDADDVVALLKNLDLSKADFLAFSNGGHTAFEMAIHYPEQVSRLIICSSFYKRTAANPSFWDGFTHAKFSDMPQSLKDGFLAVNKDPDKLLNMFNKDVQRMKTFTDWSDEQIRSIKAHTLIMNSTIDVGSPEHAVEMFRIIPDSELVILPGKHGEYLGAVESLNNGKWQQSYAVNIIEDFLESN